jgi:hypothetical protein
LGKFITFPCMLHALTASPSSILSSWWYSVNPLWRTVSLGGS